MTLENLCLFLFLALICEILGTVGGFGSSVFFVPVASLFLDFFSVLGITALFHISSNITKIVLFRKGYNKKLILTIGIPAVIFVAAGAYLSKFIDKTVLEYFLAFFLIILSALFLIYRKLVVKPTITNSILGGGISGFIAGLVGTGGVVRGMTLAAFNLEKNTFIATSAAIDLGVDLTRGTVYFSNGYVHKHDLYLIPLLLVISIIGTLAGKRILYFISEDRFKSIVLILIFLVGLMTMIRQVYRF